MTENAATPAAENSVSSTKIPATRASQSARASPASRSSPAESTGAGSGAGPDAGSGGGGTKKRGGGAKRRSAAGGQQPVFCVCRRPDNHAWMIGCDGGCEDWYHPKCVGIEQADGELIDKYICACSFSRRLPVQPILYVCVLILTVKYCAGPSCEKRLGAHTTWKPMCRLPDCRRPARVTARPPSKYCSDNHGLAFMRAQLTRVRPVRRWSAESGESEDEEEDEEVREEMERDDGEERQQPQEPDSECNGGVLSAGELKTIVSSVSSAQELRELGEKITPLVSAITVKRTQSPPPSSAGEATTSRTDKAEPSTTTATQSLDDTIASLDISRFTDKESAHFQHLCNIRAAARVALTRQKARQALLETTRARARAMIDAMVADGTKPKDVAGVCGFDSRLAWSDVEVEEWWERGGDNNEGEKNEKGADGVNGANGVHSNDATLDAGEKDTVMGGTEEANANSNGNGRPPASATPNPSDLCTRKRCERHRQWVKVQQQDIDAEARFARDDLVRCESEMEDTLGRIALRVLHEGA